MTSPTAEKPSILIAGASRGLGHALSAAFVQRGWRVVGTVRDAAADTPLHQLAKRHPDQVDIEALDLCRPEQIAALARKLSGRRFDILFVNAGTTNRDPTQTIGEVSTEEFMHVMHTNALGPMRVIERLEHCVTATGLIGAMSSGQGSIGNNEQGRRELYRGSKAALNMFMRSFAARQADTARAMVLLAPGWIRTDLGGPNAPFSLEETVPDLIDVLLSRLGTPGLAYLDRFGETVPW
ncbi:3-oxoacyl-ACP reductase [Oleiagrimonas soli]|nr:SDR family NAD(P)-dependent oxidoreductase [Oleiagrimonas soli]KGI78079.1 3-oxoacyl-ACP reductase [Oleiagrimonas soli]